MTKRGRGRPVDPRYGRRVRLNGCYVNSITLKRLQASGMSQGKAIDQAVAASFAHVKVDN